MIENREPAITETLRMEGGGQYTDRATDRGGPTRWGVAHKTLALSRGVPSVTPEEVMDKVAAAVDKAMKDPTITQRLKALGIEPMGGTRADFVRFTQEERKRLGEIVRAANMKDN